MALDTVVATQIEASISTTVSRALGMRSLST
jgi:hypothetical protein